jgi:hypothetical protein
MKRIITIAIILATVFGGKLSAQFDHTLYNMTPVFQSNLLNPAFIPDVQYHFGVPALSSVYAGFGTSGVKYSQAFTRRADDSLNIDFNGIVSHVKAKNAIIQRDAVQWLNGGMRWKDYYFSFSVSDIVDWNVLYSGDMVKLAVNGNAQFIGKTVSFAPSYLKATHYREYAFGAAWDFDSQWNFGAKVKMLFGKSNIHTKSLDASLHTEENNYYLTTETNIMINTSMPASWREGDGVNINSAYLFYGGSFGMSVDLGATYKLNDELAFSASVLDLGYIKFDRNFKNFSNNNVKWTFEGIDALEFDGMTDDEIDQRLKEIGDSLKKKFEIEETWHSYNIMMTAKVYLAGTYKLSDIETLGAVFRSEIINKTWRPSLSLSYYRQIFDNLGVIGSYTIINRGYFNIGAGVYYNYKPVQVYLVTDNLVGVFIPDAVHYANIHFGVNIYFPKGRSGNTLIDF